MIVGVSMVKDEADIIATTVGQMMTQVDWVIVADNGSTDGTREILDRLPITVVDDPDPAYRQSQKMTRLARRAHEMGADWVVPFDADEWWSGEGGRIADVLDKVGDDFQAATACLYDHMVTGVDPAVDNPVRRMGWRRQTMLGMPKVACRTHDFLRIEQGNHSVTYDGKPPAMVGGLLTVHHFPYRSAEQFVRKVRNGAAAYAAGPDIRADFGAHWRQWGKILDRLGEQAVVDIFNKWYRRNDPHVPVEVDGQWLEALVYDPVA